MSELNYDKACEMATIFFAPPSFLLVVVCSCRKHRDPSARHRCQRISTERAVLILNLVAAWWGMVSGVPACMRRSPSESSRGYG